MLARENEPFETELREETLLLREVLLEAAARSAGIEPAYDAVVRDRELRGLGPSGVFAKGERGDHLRALHTWAKALAENGIPYDAIELYRFGRAGEHARADAVHEALVLDVDVDRCGRGAADGARRNRGADVAARAGGGGVDHAGEARERGDGRVGAGGAKAGACCAPSSTTRCSRHRGSAPDRGHKSLLVVATPGEDRAWTRTSCRRSRRTRPRAGCATAFASFSASRTRTSSRARRSSCTRARPARAVVPVLEEARDKLRGGDGPPALRSAYGPVPRPQEYPIPDEGRARR